MTGGWFRDAAYSLSAFLFRPFDRGLSLRLLPHNATLLDSFCKAAQQVHHYSSTTHMLNTAICVEFEVTYEGLDQKLWNCASQATYCHSDSLL